ncbi:MAG: alpha/beta hydrolase [Candidatus Acidiferrales bacterium]
MPEETAEYAARGREAVRELAAKQFDKVYAQFDQKMAAALPAEQISQAWDTVIGSAGDFSGIRTVRVEEHGPLHVARLTCIFAQRAADVVVSFDADGRIAGLFFTPPIDTHAVSWTPPEYKFHEEQVTVTDGQWRLPGILTLPDGKGPFPAVTLVPGSGPEDEDETIGPNKPFKDLAWGLASHGIAVLRYTKRTKQYGAASVADPKNFTVKDEYIDDARAAVALLAARKDIDGKHILLAGHSEGGYIAPRIAAGDSQIAGIVILEGNARPIEQLVIEQLHYQVNLGGPNSAQIQKLIPEAEEEAKTIESEDLKPGMNVKLLGASIPASYFLDLRGYDPADVAAKLKIPIFVVQGGRDYQVTIVDFIRWKRDLAGHSNAKLKLYPALNHLLVAGTGPSSPEEYMEPGHVSGEVIGDLAAWVQAQAAGVSQN